MENGTQVKPFRADACTGPRNAFHEVAADTLQFAESKGVGVRLVQREGNIWPFFHCTESAAFNHAVLDSPQLSYALILLSDNSCFTLLQEWKTFLNEGERRAYCMNTQVLSEICRLKNVAKKISSAFFG